MFGGPRLGSIAGVPIVLDWSFALLAVLLVAPPLLDSGMAAAASALALLLSLAVAVLLHEGGHALAAARYRIPSKRVVLTGFGGFVEFARPPMSRTQENVIAFAGPAANLATAGALYATQGAATWWSPLGTLMLISVAMGVFNLLPAYPLDGGAIARNLIGLRFTDRTALSVTLWAGIIIGGYLALMGFASNQFWAMMGGLYIVGSCFERRQGLRGRRAR